MITVSLKILPSLLLSETDKGYIFKAVKTEKKKTFSIPKSQIIKITQNDPSDPYWSEDLKSWITITVTEWIWNKGVLKKQIELHKSNDDAVIIGQRHFGINWDFVVQNKRKRDICYYCMKKFENDKTRDHLIPKMILKAYGIDRGLKGNVVSSCYECNKEKSSLHPEMYLEMAKRKLKETGDPKYRTIIFILNKTLEK